MVNGLQEFGMGYVFVVFTVFLFVTNIVVDFDLLCLKLFLLFLRTCIGVFVVANVLGRAFILFLQFAVFEPFSCDVLLD